MFTELARVLEHAGTDGIPLASLQQFVTGKRTKVNQTKTDRYLTALYRFDPKYPPFAWLRYFWLIAPHTDHPQLALLFAIEHDYLLAESLETILMTPFGASIFPEVIETLLERNHPNYYTAATKTSIARRLISSFKQAGYLTGKVRNVRVPVLPSYSVVTFALLLSYLRGERGEYLLQSRSVRALAIPTAQLHNHLMTASQHNLLTYQRAGQVLVISFDSLLYQRQRTNGF